MLLWHADPGSILRAGRAGGGGREDSGHVAGVGRMSKRFNELWKKLSSNSLRDQEAVELYNLGVGDSWQAIETAPKGRYVIIYQEIGPNTILMEIGIYYDTEGSWIAGETDIEPTHWMPLPEPPQTNEVSK